MTNHEDGLEQIILGCLQTFGRDVKAYDLSKCVRTYLLSVLPQEKEIEELSIGQLKYQSPESIADILHERSKKIGWNACLTAVKSSLGIKE